MIKQYFSERDLGKSYDNEEINYKVFNGILTIYKKNINYFAHDFPVKCKKCYEVIEIDEVLLEKTIEAQIPNFKVKYKNSDDTITKEERYAILNFLEFCYEYMWEGFITTYFREDDKCKNHNHYFYFRSKRRGGEKFRKEVNRILEINNSIFFLDKDGKVKRRLPFEMNSLIENINLNTDDNKLNELIYIAIKNIKHPNEEERKIAIEKLWDAFERMKTYYSIEKKKSLKQLIHRTADGTEQFDDIIEAEFKQLTYIGNNYQIRHFETDKKEIHSPKHLDYLFYRMLVLLNLCISVLKE